MITRAQWGAKHGVGASRPGPKPRVVIHHSYKPALQPTASEQQERDAVRSIEHYHVRSNGWDGIGYNFLVAPSGRVYEGRGWGRQGAHAGPVNATSVGICLLIDGTVTEPNDASIRAVRGLIAAGLTRGEIAEGYKISGHRDHMARTCPGDKVYARLQELRHDAGAASPAPELPELPGHPQPGDVRWSDYLGERVVLTEWRSDTDYRYLPVSRLKGLGLRGTSAWSALRKL